VTDTLSVAVNDVTGIFKLAEGDVAVNEVTVGAVVSVVVYEKEEFAASGCCSHPLLPWSL